MVCPSWYPPHSTPSPAGSTMAINRSEAQLEVPDPAAVMVTEIVLTSARVLASKVNES